MVGERISERGVWVAGKWKRLGWKGLWVGSGVLRRGCTLRERTFDPHMGRERKVWTNTHALTSLSGKHTNKYTLLSHKALPVSPQWFYLSRKKKKRVLPWPSEGDRFIICPFVFVHPLRFPLSFLLSLPPPFVWLHGLPFAYQLPWQITRDPSISPARVLTQRWRRHHTRCTLTFCHREL